MFKAGHPINKRNATTIHAPDKMLLYAIGLLVVLGLIFLSSASAVVAYTRYGSSEYFLYRQFLFALVGGAFFYFCYKVDYHLWKKYALFFLIISCLFLLLLFVPGLAMKGETSRSWLDILGFSLQPSEFVKIFFLIYLAAWLESRRQDLNDLREGIGPFLLVLGIIAVLMMLQPDFGTLAIIGTVSLIVYFVGGGKISHLLIIFLAAILAIVIMVHFKPYQMQRFECAFNPTVGASDQCYQLNQSLIAVGSGGIFGRGLGQSRQKFNYLPEVYGDSIFAVMAEEIGFIFDALFILLCLFIFYRLILIAKSSPDVFGKLLATGVASWLAIQTFFNIGGIIGLIPMTGVPLPLVSQGGSSIMAAMIGLGIVMNISRQTIKSVRN
jgi:cell division protein FtsW